MKSTLMIATSNPGKRHEFAALLANCGLELRTPADLSAPPAVEETGGTYADNATLKARAYAVTSGLFALADDSGLEVDALNGAPGLHSARIAGPGRSDADRRALLLKHLRPFPRPWPARFRCVAALASPDGAVWTAEGICEGEIIPAERGEHGFGYDPIFLIAARGLTMAELSGEDKNAISHRGRAVNAILPLLLQKLNSLT